VAVWEMGLLRSPSPARRLLQIRRSNQKDFTINVGAGLPAMGRKAALAIFT